MITTILAIYSSLIASILGAISISNFIRDRRILTIEKHVQFSLDEAFYRFVISNISSRPFTIIDCTIMNIAKTESGKLEPDWGVSPKKIQSLFGEDNKVPLEIPQTLHPGQILIVGVSTLEIVEQFSFYASTPIGTKKWQPTEMMFLEIMHSMSNKLHTLEFKLENTELEKLKNKLELR